jgi:hypothetical protein
VRRPCSLLSLFPILSKYGMALCLAVGCAYGQDYYSKQEIRVSGLRAMMARSKEPSDVLLTSLDIVLHDRRVCCGKDSALEESAERVDASSLKDISTKLQGRHLLGDGRPIMITAEYFEPAAINSGMLITTLHDQHALLMAWKSHVYVCYGVTYVKDYDPNSGAEIDTISSFLLLDTRYSDSRRKVVFNRGTDDWSKVEGVLRLTVAAQ